MVHSSHREAQLFTSKRQQQCWHNTHMTIGEMMGKLEHSPQQPPAETLDVGRKQQKLVPLWAQFTLFAWHISVAEPFSQNFIGFFFLLPELLRSHGYSGSVPPPLLGLSGGCWKIKHEHEWISERCLCCGRCHAAVAVDNMCQGTRAHSSSVELDNPHCVFFSKEASTAPDGTSVE